MFKFRSGTHGLNEELGRHRGEEGKSECPLCGAECSSESCVVEVFSLLVMEKNLINKLNSIAYVLCWNSILMI